MTLSPSLQSSGDVFKSEYCFALVFPRATGFTASVHKKNSEHIVQQSRQTHLGVRGLEGVKP